MPSTPDAWTRVYPRYINTHLGSLTPVAYQRYIAKKFYKSRAAQCTKQDSWHSSPNSRCVPSSSRERNSAVLAMSIHLTYLDLSSTTKFALAKNGHVIGNAILTRSWMIFYTPQGYLLPLSMTSSLYGQENMRVTEAAIGFQYPKYLNRCQSITGGESCEQESICRLYQEDTWEQITLDIRICGSL